MDKINFVILSQQSFRISHAIVWRRRAFRQNIQETHCDFQTLSSRGARFFLVQHTKTGKIYLNDQKIYQVAIKYTKWL
jgi:hypothetical protein